MDILEYLGYQAKLHFDRDDQIFVGEVLGLSDSLSFYAESSKEVQAMFQQCVDNYLDFCREVGKEPERTYKGSFNVRIPPELHRQADHEATRRGIPLNQLVGIALRNELSAGERFYTAPVGGSLQAEVYEDQEEPRGKVLDFRTYHGKGANQWTALEN